ncbi:50S ribosomal protein L28 [Candidatus Marinamargulisbacteria bacterium SCGC AAA071-K20]|nr:50S ribosomal protein L28 [Candidatus Marinamargulisbacteria bacterium SCGC AAA071-K20]
MSRKCEISKIRGLTGNRVSHSKRRTKHVQEVNLQTKKFWNPEKGCWVKLKVSAKMIKTIDKNGLTKTINKYAKKKAK